MARSRLITALEGGAVELPAQGTLGVWQPPAGADLEALPRDRVFVVQRFRPDHDTWAARGWHVGLAPEGRLAWSLVVLPRARDAARALVAEARAATDGPLVIDGQKTDGVETMLRDLRKRGEVGEVTAQAHGKLFTVHDADVADWAGARAEVAGGYVTAPGVFSADGPDAGSRALAEALPAKLGAQVADLGAGWGWLSAQVLDRPGIEALHLVEADHTALDCARANVTDDRARFHWADVRSWRADQPLDAVISNPPFHTGRAADPDLGRDFIVAGAGLLKPSGRMWLVANRHLPYEAAARAAFAEVEEIAGDAKFKILACARPRKERTVTRRR